jgi:hypothetical protein
VQYQSRRVVLTSEDFENRLFVMESTMNQLDEVVIRRYNNINAVSLGLFQQTKNHIRQQKGS